MTAGPPNRSEAGRRSKGQKRLDHILERIPIAREQLLAAIEDLGAPLTLDAIKEAAKSTDPRERNKVAVIERELDILIVYLEEFASRGLVEVRREDPSFRSDGRPWERLADLGVISQASAMRLQNIKEMRNELAHAYPPISWRALHQAVEALLEELDGYKVKVADWLTKQDVLDP